jgi:hypothetical protein
MLHAGERLLLQTEARQHLRSVHATLQHLERHLPANRLRLHRPPDEAKTTLAQTLGQTIGTDAAIEPGLLHLIVCDQLRQDVPFMTVNEVGNEVGH